jgi:hypothetical protein
MAWLARRLDATRTPNPQQVLALLPDFNREIQTLRDIWERSLPWVDILSAGLVARKLDAET